VAVVAVVAVVGWSGSRLASVTARARWRRGRASAVRPSAGRLFSRRAVVGWPGPRAASVRASARCATGRAPVCRPVAPSVTARPARWLAVVGTRSARGRHVAWLGPPPVAELGRPRAVFASEDRALTFARFVASSSGQFGCTDSRPRQGWPLRRAPTAPRPCLLRLRIRRGVDGREAEHSHAARRLQASHPASARNRPPIHEVGVRRSGRNDGAGPRIISRSTWRLRSAREPAAAPDVIDPVPCLRRSVGWLPPEPACATRGRSSSASSGSTDAERGPRMDHISPARLPGRGDRGTSEQLGAAGCSS
jgi:hypothetical protein